MKYTENGDVFACSFAVSVSLAIAIVTACGGFVSIMHVAAGAGLGGRKLAEKGEHGHRLDGRLGGDLDLGRNGVVGLCFSIQKGAEGRQEVKILPSL